MAFTQGSVFITGAASGIGRATALRFASEGYLVCATDVDEAGLRSLQTEAPKGSVTRAALDVTNADAWSGVLDDFMKRTSGRLDILVNNAGLLRAGNFVDLPLDAQQRVMRVNVDGVMNGCYAAYPYLKATPGAQVVNMCSASAIYGQAELAAYSASKFAVRGLTEALDIEWRSEDIRVFALWPLFVDTSMIATERTGSMTSLGVHLTARDVADKIFQTTRPARHPIPRPTHIPVGTQAALMFNSAQVTPLRLLRAVNRRIARK
ncbi:SDR family oxidoreductase [Hoyosella subflava]|uniref:Short chain dehydrogenase/reductase family oxidoreductase n=1 Tax=Hoyosella subflava (strain DSM 45089 / JCM 17490 / NBRC 109087 / DQS3-9A1) TaxID=443218 RepID=F6EPR7_HOYSD|nr:SDR family oxidoreductase [Hoyosella subflava]AEF40546.1 Short chain dehydrogenase/reductase family oxidoreductase [Hoyosella subflava DQS3-9A1]